MRLDVRCCCNPNLLLGWLDVPTEKVRPGAKLVLPVLEQWSAEFGTPMAAQIHLKTVQLEVGIVVGALGRRVLAVKSNDTPIELLKRCAGFLENAGCVR